MTKEKTYFIYVRSTGEKVPVTKEQHDSFYICDFKYGVGVVVSAEKNPQLMCYALGAYNAFGDLYDIKTVKLSIYQDEKAAMKAFRGVFISGKSEPYSHELALKWLSDNQPLNTHWTMLQVRSTS